MKKIFYGSTYLLMLVMMFTYMLIEQDFSGEVYGQSLLSRLSGTGISVIGFLFIFPAFIFTILGLCMNKKMTTFCRDMFSLFAGVFCLATGIIGLFVYAPYYYISIILTITSCIVFGLSLINVIKMMNSEKDVKENN